MLHCGVERFAASVSDSLFERRTEVRSRGAKNQRIPFGRRATTIADVQRQVMRENHSRMISLQ